MAKGSRGGKVGASGSSLNPRETAFVKFSPTGLHPEGETIIARTNDGRYRYMGNIPDWDDIRVDTDSQDYKQAKHDFNVKAQFLPDGQVVISKGGLYDRKKVYKNAEDFRVDVKKRIQSRSSYDKAERDSLIKGNISEIQADYFKGIVRKNSKSMAIKKMKESMNESMKAVKARLAVAEKAKSRIDDVIDSGKRQIKIRFGQ